MRPPIDITKITSPHSSHVLKRLRLLERLEQHRDKKLILILGQAAQGKSTLALSFVETSMGPSAWLNLGPEDSEAVNLFYLLVQSLQRALPESDISQLLTYPSLGAGPRQEVPLYRDWLLTLLNQVQSPVQIIFDGLDRLEPQAAAFRFLQVLLEVAPPHLHLLMLSREMPPLKIQELKMRQEAYILGNADLAFTPKETGNFLRTVRRLRLPHDLITQLRDITEGWIGGLILLCEILERLPEAARENFLRQDFTDKLIEEVSGYFNETIFPARSEAEREFLIKSSILNVVDPAFIKDYLGLDRAQDIMEDLSGKNLFVQPIFDKQRGWLYRYHQLFQDFLQARFKQDLPSEEQASSYLRAASLLEERGDLESAVDFFLQAGATDRAAAAIERVGFGLLNKGQTSALERWLQTLPSAVWQERPWLLFYHYLTGRLTGQPEYFHSLQKAHNLFQNRHEFRGLLLTSGHLIEVALLLGHTAALATQLSQAEELLHRVGDQAFPYESAFLWFRLGFGLMQTRQGYRALRHAHLLAKDLGERHLEIHALIYASFSLAMQGEFSEAERLRQEADQSLATWTSPELQAELIICSIHLSIFQGELEAAARLLKMAQEYLDQHGLIYLYPWIQLYSFMYLESSGKYDEAKQMGLSLLNFASSKGMAHIIPPLLLHLACLHYHQGNLRAAQEFIEQGLQVCTAGGSTHLCHFNVTRILAGLIYQAGGELEPSRDLELEEVLKFAADNSNYLVLADGHWALALRRWRQGRLQEAAAHVRAGMIVAARRGSYYSAILSPQDRGRIFTLALELGVEEVWERLPPLLAGLAAWVGPDLERLSRHAKPRIAAKACEIRRAIRRQGLPRLEIRTLGGFQLSSAQEPKAEPVWEGSQPKLLLKALVARGGANVPQEVLIEDLWPESEPALTEQTFRVNLHRLRKILEPDLDKSFGSAYLRSENGLLSLDRELCRLDVNEFLSLHAAGERQEQQGNLNLALARYQEALALYGGDFLSEELYLPWAENRRTELRGVFLELLERVSQIYERQGSLTRTIDYCKKIIQVDPVSEPTYRRLMTLYANRGRRSEALQTYEACRKALAKELEVEPDEVTTAIFRKIKETG